MRTIHAMYLCESQADCDRLWNVLQQQGQSIVLERIEHTDAILTLENSGSEPDCLLCGAGAGALSAIKNVRSEGYGRPVIYLGHGESEEALIEALEQGATEAFDLRRDTAAHARLLRCLCRLNEPAEAGSGEVISLRRHRDEYLCLSDAVLIVNLIDRTILDLNEAAEDLYGYPRAELVGRKTNILYANEADYLDMSRRCIEVLKDSVVYSGGTFCKRKDGEVFRGFIHGFKLAESKESDPIVAVLVRYVSDENSGAVDLSGEILNKINNVVLVANRAGAIIYVSPSVRNILGYDPEELLDDGWWRLTRESDEQAEQEREYIAECARGELPTISEPYENRIKVKDGSFRWILWSDSRAATDHVIGVGTDITERRQAELELRRSRDELSEQTFRLMSTNRELDAFAYSVSHDLKSPLRRIASYAEMLENEAGDQLNEQSHRFVGNICRNCDQMSDLIGDLLEFSRTSRSELAYERVDLSRAADQIAEYLRRDATDRTIRFHIEVGLCAEADPSMVRVLLENLLRNAVKFTFTREEAEIEFGCIEEQEEKTFYIRDNGVGFDPELADRLFVPFSRLHSGEQFTGTGLGLAIVRRIVERHGGRVWAEGQEDVGATFYFTLN